MQQDLVDKIKRLPEYHQLVKQRGRLAWRLTALMLAAYFGFILLVAFFPEVFQTVVWGQYTTIGFPLGVGIILLAFVLTGIYVYRANRHFDALTHHVRKVVER
jgi:uncharacterized membrane protein (DUF485 family)